MEQIGNTTMTKKPSRRTLPAAPLKTEATARTYRLGIASDHGGFEPKRFLSKRLRAAGHDVKDFGDRKRRPNDDYPDYVIPLARAVASGKVDRGVAICGSGVGVAIAANKVRGVRACVIHDAFSAHQGVEDDDLNVICLGGLVLGQAAAWELMRIFLSASFSGAERHVRRRKKVMDLEKRGWETSS